jgi:hypothetical protein
MWVLPIEFQSKSDEKRREEKRMTAVTKWKGNAADFSADFSREEFLCEKFQDDSKNNRRSLDKQS